MGKPPGYRTAVAWDFWWYCTVCHKERDHLVNEHPGQLISYGRCRVCTRLVKIGDEHRALQKRAHRFDGD